MSYSFSENAVSKAELIAKVKERWADIVATQPMHELDRKPAIAVAEAFINMTREPKEAEKITISMWGSLSWQELDVIYGSGVNLTVSINS